MELEEDFQKAKAVARKYGVSVAPDESIEGLVRNILTVLSARDELHKQKVEELRDALKFAMQSLEQVKERAPELWADLLTIFGFATLWNRLRSAIILSS